MDKAALDLLASWKHNVPKFAFDNFGVELEPWSREVSEATTATQKARVAMQAAVGVGKSFTMAINAWHFLATNADLTKYPSKFPNGFALSITGDNLKSGLWKELGVWYNASDFLKSQFEYSGEQIVHRDYPLNWWLRARSFAKSAAPETQGAALSGLHSPWSIVLLDEIGEMHPAIGRKAEQTLSDAECERGLVLAAGNPTSLNGLLYDIATAGKGWSVVRITGDPDDPKRSSRVDIEWAREQIAKYGRDNPWVMAHILGEFPPGGLNSLITPDEVRSSFERSYVAEDFQWSQRRFGVDVARFGDDRTVIFPRQGLVAFPPVELRHQDTNAIAAQVLTRGMKWGVEQVAIDDTGHWGHGVVDNLNTVGSMAVLAVNFADRKTVNPRYFNRRAEMWFEMAEWIKRGGALPKHEGLLQELCAATYYFQEGKVRIVEKDAIKETLGRSPDLADGLALTFALPDMPSGFSPEEGQRFQTRGRPVRRASEEWETSRIVRERDPFADL